MNISRFRVGESIAKFDAWQIFSKVDDGVTEFPFATFGNALPARVVGMAAVDLEVAADAEPTRVTLFQGGVSMELGHGGGGDAASTVESVDVLADEKVQFVAAVQLDQSHVGRRGNCRAH